MSAVRSSAPEPMAVADVLAAGREAMGKDGLLPMQAADRLLASGAALSDDALRFFVRIGVARQFEADLFSFRRSSGSSEASEQATVYARFQRKSPHLGMTGALRMLYEGADGRAKPLFEFTRGDWRYLRETLRGQAKGLTRKAAAARTAEQILLEHGSDCTADLPADALAEVDRAVSEAWS